MSAFYSCIPTGMHGPTCIFWASLIPFSLKRVDWPGTATRVPADLRMRRCRANLLTARAAVAAAGPALPDIYFVEKGKSSQWIFAFGVHHYQHTAYASADAMAAAMKPMVRGPRPRGHGAPPPTTAIARQPGF